MTPRKFLLNRVKTLSFLGQLERIADPVTKSYYFLPGINEQTVEESFESTNGSWLPNELTKAIISSKTGSVLFYSEERKTLILPPFPLKEGANYTGLNCEPLRKLLESDFTIGLILLHLGTYGIGLYEGEKLITSKVGTGLIHGRHKKGGSSQQRFQRRRQNQVNEFLSRVCRHIQEQLEPHVKHLDYTIYGGPRQTVLQLKKKCPFLQSLGDQSLPLMEVPSLRQKVLEDIVTRVWSSGIIEWQADDS